MKIARLYTGGDRKSYFEISSLSSAAIRKFSPPTRGRRRWRFSAACRRGPFLSCIPRRYNVRLLGDRSKRRRQRIFKADDVMLADDNTGEGHRSRLLGNVPHIFMTVPLGD